MIRRKYKIVETITETIQRQNEVEVEIECADESEYDDIVDRVKDKLCNGYMRSSVYAAIDGVVEANTHEGDSDVHDSETTYSDDYEDMEDEKKVSKSCHYPSWF